jgi:general secretion pathway protein B
MSYILEALKKLEQKRGQEDAPQLFTFSRESRVERRTRAWWPYVLAGALLVNAIVMIWWMNGRREGEGEATAARGSGPGPYPDAGPSVRAPAQPPLMNEERLAPRPAIGVPVGREAIGRADVNGRGTDVPAPLPPMAETDDAQTAAPLPASVARPPEETRTPERPAARAEIPREKAKKPSGRVIDVRDLPAAIRGGLPEFRISGHAYSSEPQTRVARINEKILQEGQDLSPGLRVDEIVPEGVVFDYRGYRFRVGIK